MYEIIYQSVIPLHPVTKKNNQRIMIRSVYKNGRKTEVPFIMQSEKYKQYEHDAGWFLKRIKPPISEPVNVRVLFYRKNEIKCDLTNLLEAIDDILVKYKVLADDNFMIIAGHDGSRVFIDKENPRTEIYIERFVE